MASEGDELSYPYAVLMMVDSLRSVVINGLQRQIGLTKECLEPKAKASSYTSNTVSSTSPPDTGKPPTPGTGRMGGDWWHTALQGHGGG
jgi:hypothetical protein